MLANAHKEHSIYGHRDARGKKKKEKAKNAGEILTRPLARVVN